MARPLFQRLKFSRQSIWFQAVFPGGSIALCAVATFIFLVQPDVCAAILVLPRWLWILPGLVLAAMGWTRKRKRVANAPATLWLLYTIFFVLEFPSLIQLRSSVPD